MRGAVKRYELVTAWGKIASLLELETSILFVCYLLNWMPLKLKTPPTGNVLNI